MTIFVNYRRDDSQAIVGRIDDHLRRVFGTSNVYRDIDNIPPGVDFRKRIEESLQECDVFVACIGTRWVSNRLMAQRDWVRVELEVAFKREVPVIPVLLDGAVMPVEANIPPSLYPLLDRQAVHINSGASFANDFAKLTRGIQLLRSEAAKRESARKLAELWSGPWLKIAIALLAVAALSVSWNVWGWNPNEKPVEPGPEKEVFAKPAVDEPEFEKEVFAKPAVDEDPPVDPNKAVAVEEPQPERKPEPEKKTTLLVIQVTGDPKPRGATLDSKQARLGKPIEVKPGEHKVVLDWSNDFKQSFWCSVREGKKTTCVATDKVYCRGNGDTRSCNIY